MNAYIYDEAGSTIKHVIPCRTATVHYRENEELTASITTGADALYKGNIVLGDIIRMPYPHPKEVNGQPFRIHTITADDDVLTINARHITDDFRNAFCSDAWKTSETTLQNFVTQLNGTAIKNKRGISFDFFKHDTNDPRYSARHQCSISFRDGEAILERIHTIYGCNFIKDGTTIILTYGTPSDYFRQKHSLPPHSAIYRAGRNVDGYSAELSNDDAITSIVCCFEMQDATGNDMTYSLGRVNRTGMTTAEAAKHLILKIYRSDLEQGDLSWQDWYNAVAEDCRAQAQDEVDSQNDVTQNISIDAVAVSGDFIFGGERCLCADERTQTDMQLQIVAFDFDAANKTYNGIQLGRALIDLRDLGKAARRNG